MPGRVPTRSKEVAMRKPKGFDDVYGRSARADGDAGTDIAQTMSASTGKWGSDDWGVFFQSLLTGLGATLTGVGAVIDSTNNTARTNGVNGVQYLPGVQTQSNNSLLWVLGGGLLLVVLLVLVLRKK